MKSIFKPFHNLHRKGREHVTRRPYLLPFFGLILGGVVVAGVFYYRGGTETFRPSDSHVVFLFDSGKKATIDTKAKTVGALISRLNLHLIPQDVVEPSADTPIVEDNFRINIYHARPVTIVDGSAKSVTLTAQMSARVAAENAGLEVQPEDLATFTEGDIKNNVIGEQVVVARATPVMLNLYGTQVPSYTQAHTVGSLLSEKHIKLDHGETVNPVATTPITPNMQVFVLTKGSQVVTVEQTVAPPVQTVNDISLSFGTKVVRQPGQPGKEAVTYLINVQKGVEVSRQIIQRAIVQAPVPEIDAIGSTIDIDGDKTGIIAAAGISSGNYAYVNFIVSHESGWRPHAANPSGAYGLCQALPGAKMASAGGDWATNPVTQLKWCNGYAVGRYGSWGAAYSHWLAARSW